jgi:predicted DNA-binding transcriptional regulator AlpA
MLPKNAAGRFERGTAEGLPPAGERDDGEILARDGRRAASLLIDADEAAALANVSRSTWWKLHASGRCPAPVKLGGRTLWRREELRRWVDHGCPSRARWNILAAQESSHE